MKQPVKRRKPSQERARRTQLLIFEAAARILEEQGLRRFTTNRLAELSGFSVGTLYQYFPDKQAILQALARHEQEKTFEEIRQSLLSSDTGAAGTAVLSRTRVVVRTVLHAFGGRQRARRILIELALQSGRHPSLEHPAATLAALLSSGTVAGRQGSPLTLTEMDAFVLIQAVVGAMRGALTRDERLLKKPEFEDALVRLIDGFVPSPVAAAPRPARVRQGA
jgi:AcrR family transcriptional regulator